jgi:hypothetical protein
MFTFNIGEVNLFIHFTVNYTTNASPLHHQRFTFTPPTLHLYTTNASPLGFKKTVIILNKQ